LVSLSNLSFPLEQKRKLWNPSVKLSEKVEEGAFSFGFPVKLLPYGGQSFGFSVGLLGKPGARLKSRLWPLLKEWKSWTSGTSGF